MAEHRKLDADDIRVFSGSSNLALANDIAGCLGVPLGETNIRRFNNDNMYVQLGQSVRSRNVFIIQSMTPPVNDHLMEMLMMLDIARSASGPLLRITSRCSRRRARRFAPRAPRLNSIVGRTQECTDEGCASEVKEQHRG